MHQQNLGPAHPQANHSYAPTNTGRPLAYPVQPQVVIGTAFVPPPLPAQQMPGAYPVPPDAQPLCAPVTPVVAAPIHTQAPTTPVAHDLEALRQEH